MPHTHLSLNGPRGRPGLVMHFALRPGEWQLENWRDESSASSCPNTGRCLPPDTTLVVRQLKSLSFRGWQD